MISITFAAAFLRRFLVVSRLSVGYQPADSVVSVGATVIVARAAVVSEDAATVAAGAVVVALAIVVVAACPAVVVVAVASGGVQDVRARPRASVNTRVTRIRLILFIV